MPGAFAEYACVAESTSGVEAGQPHVRAGGGGPSGRADRPARPSRSRASPAGPEGADHRCVGRRWDVRRADREVTRRGRDRRLQYRNVELVRSLGADHVIDYTREDFTQSGQRYDLIFHWREPFAIRPQALAHLEGTLVLSSGDSDGPLDQACGSPRQSGRAVTVRQPGSSARFSREQTKDDLKFLKELIEAGDLQAGDRQDLFARRNA